MNGVFIKDDEQVVALHVRRRFSSMDFTDVRIEAVEGDDDMDVAFDQWCNRSSSVHPSV